MGAVTGDAKAGVGEVGGAHPHCPYPLCGRPELYAQGATPAELTRPPPESPGPGRFSLPPRPLKVAGGSGLSWAQGRQPGGLPMPNLILLC